MSKISLAPRNSCTGCGSCAESCPVQCIQMVPDRTTDCTYPLVDTQMCLECGRCQKVCPAITAPQKLEKGTVFVGWNTDQKQRSNAASGGIITAIYQYALENRIKAFGVRYSIEDGAQYTEISRWEDVEACRNSKYVFSDLRSVLKKIKQYLDAGEKVILPALPCQNAAVLAFLGSRPENLLLIDIVCHGVSPEAYLKQHIASIEDRKRAKADKVFFRDPNYGTNNFVFSIYQNTTNIYHAPVHEKDVYQLGYHKSLIYRENCYHCAYATPERLGDLSVADFSGLGREAPFERDSGSYSCVIVSSQKGQMLLDALCNAGRIKCQMRPSEEAFAYERQLRTPSVPHPNRGFFLEEYKKHGKFGVAAQKALQKDIVKNWLVGFFRLKQLRQAIAGVLPKGIKQNVKKVMKNGK